MYAWVLGNSVTRLTSKFKAQSDRYRVEFFYSMGHKITGSTSLYSTALTVEKEAILLYSNEMNFGLPLGYIIMVFSGTAADL
jgi:hypothetical protein